MTNHQYFREETIDGREYWIDVKAGEAYEVDRIFDYFGADMADLRKYLPLFLASHHGGERFPDAIKRLYPETTIDDWKRSLELMTRFGEFLQHQARQLQRVSEYLQRAGFDTLQEAIDAHGRHSVERSLGMKLGTA